MKREGNLFEKVADFHALCAAAKRAARGKGGAYSTAAFIIDMERETLALQRDILDGTYRPKPYRTFYISDPKPRTISAADFRDRVAHHALCAVLEPLFERAAIFDSYACRKGKGSHAAVRRAQSFAGRFPYFLKLDVKKFFETVDHGVIMTGLRRLVKDGWLLVLADRIIEHGAPGSPPGKGLPIGNLTSQHFANNYLSPLDHFIKENLRVPGYIRYMDDLLFFAESKAFLRGVNQTVRDYMTDRLKLEIKTKATILAPVSEGVPFLGLRVWPHLIRLDGTSKRRLMGSLRSAAKGINVGWCTEDEVAPSLASKLGHAGHADTLALRRSLGGIMDLVRGCYRLEPRHTWRVVQQQ